MERRVKERIVGATILVALVVLVVPEFLSGPTTPTAPPAPSSPASVRTYTVDVTHVATAPPAPQPAPTSAAAERPAPQAPTEGPKASPAATAAQTTSAAWLVQVGSFASEANAQTLARQLKAAGFEAYVSPIGASAATRYRVHLGPIADRAAAERTIAKLKLQGHAASLVPPAH
jgi:DedD protein